MKLFHNFSAFRNIDNITLLRDYIIERLSQWFHIGSNHGEKIPEDMDTRDSILRYKGCIYKQKDGFFIYLDNTGESYYALIRGISLEYNLESIRCSISNDEVYPSYKINSFYQGDERVVYAYKETKWIFYEEGALRSFENPEYYKRINKPERFNYDILKEYLEKQNILIEDREFWKPVSEVIILERL
jgi:hypothetical protein